MTDKNSKLKNRLDRWKSYADQPAPPPLLPAAPQEESLFDWGPSAVVQADPSSAHPFLVEESAAPRLEHTLDGITAVAEASDHGAGRSAEQEVLADEPGPEAVEVSALQEELNAERARAARLQAELVHEVMVTRRAKQDQRKVIVAGTGRTNPRRVQRLRDLAPVRNRRRAPSAPAGRRANYTPHNVRVAQVLLISVVTVCIAATLVLVALR